MRKHPALALYLDTRLTHQHCYITFETVMPVLTHSKVTWPANRLGYFVSTNVVRMVSAAAD